jgi:UDP-N-acetylmuramoyl-L-alanyl-D-glutamate--2,6-diaminopimelate ligase
MILHRLLAETGTATLAGEGDAEISGIQHDSRRVQAGDVFVAMPGLRRRGDDFLPDAVIRGARAFLTSDFGGAAEAHRKGIAHAVLAPETIEQRAGAWTNVLRGHPSRTLKVLAVTGTNGKTTVAWLARQMIQALGEPAAYIGTLGVEAPGLRRSLDNTTPFAIDLFNLLADLRDDGTKTVCLEVSSHALALHRADGLEIDVAAFTNLSQDHLDFHGTMEAYRDAKERLFHGLAPDSSKVLRRVFNVDDATGRGWHTRFGGIGCSLKEGDFVGQVQHLGLDTLTMNVRAGGEWVIGTACIGGPYNAENLLLATAAAWRLGDYPLPDLMATWPKLQPVPGRMEAVPNTRGLTLMVDYAHTPEALGKLLAGVRTLAKGQVWVVFGCGGDRDRAKRPQMARIARDLADHVAFTADNPRTEPLAQILADMRAGLNHGEDVKEIPDRAEAVAWAVRSAQPGDTVIVAGKGHENYQIIGHETRPLDDRDLIREALCR